jgi:hypothetical protein
MDFIYNDSDHTYKTAEGLVLPSVTTILKHGGFYGDAVKYFTEYTSNRGKYVHQIIRYHLEGVLDEDTVDESLMGYYDAWLKFERESNFVPELIEKPMISVKHGFAGTPDLIGTFNKYRSTIDIKSGIVGPVVGLQTAGYEILDDQPSKRFSLQLKPDGKYNLIEYRNRQDKSIFLAAVALHNWKLNNKITITEG